MKILVIALSGIGDALMFTPAVKAIREKFPLAEIDCLAMYKGVEDIYTRIPEINKVIYHDFLNKNNFANLLFVLKLRKYYDATFSVYPSNRWHYTLISFIIGADKRFGIRYKYKDFQNLGFLNNYTKFESPELHNVEENIALAEMLIGNKVTDIPPLIFPLQKEEQIFSDNYVSDHSPEDSLMIGFHAGCSTLKNHVNRRWAPDKFAGLADRLIENYNANIFVFGGPDEEELKQSIVEKTNSEKIFNVKTQNLAQTAAVMNKMSVFVTNDSSLMHVAAALQLKVVAIIGPTNINFIKPWSTEHRIASLNLECSPCFYYSPRPLICSRTDVKYKCVRELEVDKVYNLVRELLPDNYSKA